MNSPINLLGAMSEKEFIKKFWGKRPCFVEKVIKDYKETVTREIISKISQDDQLYTKLITKHNTNFITHFGPFKKNILTKKDPYTLLIHKFHLLHHFSFSLFNSIKFIPFCRHDDVMLSFSSINGTVGPHSDSYDVFLFQGSGEKKWSIGAPQKIQIPPSEIKVEKKFKGEYEFLARPGDVIYVPPNTPHYGVANTNNCITYSIGFRSPSNHDIKQRFLEFLIDGETEKFSLYNDSHDLNVSAKAMIPNTLIKYINKNCKDALKNIDTTLFIGQFLSEPDLDTTFKKKKISFKQFSNNQAHQNLYFDPASRGLYFDNYFFINGLRLSVNKEDYVFFQNFFDKKYTAFSSDNSSLVLNEVILQLLKDGFIHFDPPKFLI